MRAGLGGAALGGGAWARLCERGRRGGRLWQPAVPSARLQQHAADQIGDLIRDDAELIFCLEDPAQALVEERDQLLRGEPELFCELEDPYFSGQLLSGAAALESHQLVRGAPTDGLAPLGDQRLALIGGDGRHETS